MSGLKGLLFLVILLYWKAEAILDVIISKSESITYLQLTSIKIKRHSLQDHLDYV